MEDGLLVAKHTEIDVNLGYEDYRIEDGNSLFKVESHATTLGPDGLSQQIALEFTKDWNFIKGTVRPNSVVRSAVVELRDRILHFQVKQLDGSTVTNAIQLRENVAPIVIFSGSLLMPFLWVRNFVQDPSVTYQIIPEGFITIRDRKRGEVSVEFVIGQEVIDYTITFGPNDGHFIGARSEKQKMKIEHA